MAPCVPLQVIEVFCKRVVALFPQAPQGPEELLRRGKLVPFNPFPTLVLVGLAVARLLPRLGLALHEHGDVVVALGGAHGVDGGSEAHVVQAQRRLLQRLSGGALRQALPTGGPGASGERRLRGGQPAFRASEGAGAPTRTPGGLRGAGTCRLLSGLSFCPAGRSWGARGW